MPYSIRRRTRPRQDHFCGQQRCVRRKLVIIAMRGSGRDDSGLRPFRECAGQTLNGQLLGFRPLSSELIPFSCPSGSSLDREVSMSLGQTLAITHMVMCKPRSAPNLGLERFLRTLPARTCVGTSLIE